MPDTRTDIAVIGANHTDIGNGIPGVVARYGEQLIAIGWDLVLAITPNDLIEGAPNSGWTVSVCDGAANHLNVLMVTPSKPTGEVLVYLAQLAREAFPTYSGFAAPKEA